MSITICLIMKYFYSEYISYNKSIKLACVIYKKWEQIKNRIEKSSLVSFNRLFLYDGDYIKIKNKLILNKKK